MRVLIGTRCLIRPKTGIGHHTQELVRALHRLPDGPKVGVFPQFGLMQAMWAWYEFAPALKKGVCDLVGRFKGQNFSSASPGSTEGNHSKKNPSREEQEEQIQEKRAPLLFRKGAAAAREFYRFFVNQTFQCSKFDLYHEPNYFPIPSELPTIVTIHDLSAILHPEWHPATRVKMHEQLFDQLLPGNTHFLTVSRFVKNQMVEKLGVHPGRVHVSCNGVREHLRPLPQAKILSGLKRMGLPSNYFLHVGTIEPRKNLGLLLEAWSDLSPDIRSKHPLVLVGNIGWKDQKTFEKINDLKGQGLIHLGYVADRDLPVLYNGARGLIFPSHDEGFGMPPVEMLACGGAVIAAPAGAVQEVTSPAAFILSSQEVRDWKLAMVRLATDEEWFRSLKTEATQTAARFTWDRCALETVAAYEKLLAWDPVAAKRNAAA